jgi:precorrin-4/cobalt-precorrin-4 C11-methyltransferase
MKMMVYFVGAGPGNPKLITVRGRELLEEADLVVYTGSLVHPKILEYIKKGEEINSYGLKLEEIINIMVNGVRSGKMVVRLHSGDLSLYSAMYEQIVALKEHGIDVEVIPGVSSLFASAAALKTELTLSGETLIITRPAGRTLEKDQIKELSRHNATLVIFLGIHKIREVIEAVELPKDTPAAVVYRASWEGERVIRGTVEDIAEKVEDAGIERSAIIIIGECLNPKEFRGSFLYG